MGEPTTPSPAFVTTHWSIVLAVGGDSPTAVSTALETLCRTYWYPLYAYVRRSGHSPHDAQDLTQEFFARLLERNDFAHVSREKGKFRSFLLASLKHFLANEWKKARRLKRGGGQRNLSFDEAEAEGRYRAELVVNKSAEQVFDRRWALTLLERALSRLRAEQTATAHAGRFESLKVFLTADADGASYREVAKELDLREDALKMAVSRLRKRYREVLREEIAHTVANPSDRDEELRYLFAALA